MTLPFIQCDEKICDKNFWCSRTSDDSSCTQSCPFETHDCNSLQSNDSKQTLTNLENGTNDSNPKEGSTYKKEDWTTILIILGSLALLPFVILLILFFMGKLPCCNFEKSPTDHQIPEIKNVANPIEMEKMHTVSFD